MTNREFSDSFDTLLNSYSTQAQFGEGSSKQDVSLDEYEKSVILTQAQDIVVKSFFDARANSKGQGFDDSTERQVDFSSLIVPTTLTQAEDQSTAFDDRGIIYNMPPRMVPSSTEGQYVADENSTDVLFILNEKLSTGTATQGKVSNYVIVPLNYKEYDRMMSKAYTQPLKKQAWRLFQNASQGFDIKSEIIPHVNVPTENLIYKIRYVRRPRPIVLENMPDNLSIDGYTQEQSCELNPILHNEILQKAVEIALSTRGRLQRQEPKE